MDFKERVTQNSFKFFDLLITKRDIGNLRETISSCWKLATQWFPLKPMKYVLFVHALQVWRSDQAQWRSYYVFHGVLFWAICYVNLFNYLMRGRYNLMFYLSCVCVLNCYFLSKLNHQNMTKFVVTCVFLVLFLYFNITEYLIFNFDLKRDSSK